jgi:multiple sugar transport system permease protein
MAMNASAVPRPNPQFRDRWRLSRKERRSLLVGLAFISPWIVGFLVFLAYPIYYTLRISFTQYTGFGEPVWTGLDNYRFMLEDDLFWTSLYNTAYYTAFAIPIGVVVAMGLALAMNQPLPEVPIYRAIIFLPSVLPVFALAFIFMLLLDPTQGIFNEILRTLRLPVVNWFGDPQWSKMGYVFMAQFGAGQVALIFLAALKGIPRELYEAANLDGASAWSRFRNVTLPMMTPVILYDLILGLSLGLQQFTAPYVITNGIGGPADSALFYVMYLYNNAFRYGQMGYAAALAWVLFLITFLLAILIFWSSSRWVYYEGK